MLTIGNSASPELRSKYCAAQVAAGAEDYHPSRDESPGQWRVSGASAGDCEQRSQELCVVALSDHVLVEIAGISRTCQGRRRS
jgi:hypothetical protein